MFMRISLKAEAVRTLAARQGATLREIGQRAGIHPSHLSKALAGHHELSARKRRALLATLGVDFDTAFTVEVDPPSVSTSGAA